MRPPNQRRIAMTYLVKKPCKTCGKLFTPCADCAGKSPMFRWRKIACSPECAKEYFDKLEKTAETEEKR